MRFSIISFLLILNVVNVLAQPLNKSSIYLSFPGDFNTREKYDVTNIAWGFLPLTDLENKFPTFQSSATEIQNEGRYFHGRVEFDAGWRLFLEYCQANSLEYADHECKSIEDKPFEYEWFAGTQHQGELPYWISSHSPVFNAFVKYQIDKVLSSPVEVIMMDAQTSSAHATRSWYQGDFSSHSVQAFQIYLKNKFTSSQLEAEGISDIDAFNYREFLIAEGITTEDEYKEQVRLHDRNETVIPLYEEFRLFQNVAINELSKELCDYIAENEDRPTSIGVSSPIDDPYRSTFLDEIDFFQLEQHMINGQYSFDPMLAYKLGENLNTSVVLTALPKEWGEIYNNNLSEEKAKEWIATAYANGANFIFPERQWARGSDFYTPSIDFTYLSSFITNNKKLFDNYVPVKGRVAVLHARKSVRKHNYEINALVRGLSSNNIPYDLVICGDEYFPSYPTYDQLNSYEKVLVSTNAYNWFLKNDDNVKNTLSSLGDKLVQCSSANALTTISNLKNGFTSTLSVIENTNKLDDVISVYPRESTDEELSPYVLHLVNKDYNTQSKTYDVKSGFEIEFDQTMFKEKILKATYHQPGKSPMNLRLKHADGKTIISNFTDLEEWAIVELSEINNDVGISESISQRNKFFNVKTIPNKNQIDIETNIGAPYTYAIYNIQGKLVYQSPMIHEMKSSTSIDLAKGIYIVKVLNQNQFTKKIIIY